VTPRRLVAASVLSMLLLGGCGGAPSASGIPGKDITTLAPELLPAEVLGLQVAHEDVSDAVEHFPETYTDAVSVWSFRSDELLQATLQVSRFRDPSKLHDGTLRRTLVSQVGGARSQTVHVGERTVYLTTGTKQRLAVWFDDRHVFVLAIRDDYLAQRNLLRAVVGVEP
jgi:hypothetical protein